MKMKNRKRPDDIEQATGLKTDKKDYLTEVIVPKGCAWVSVRLRTNTLLYRIVNKYAEGAEAAERVSDIVPGYNLDGQVPRIPWLEPRRLVIYPVFSRRGPAVLLPLEGYFRHVTQEDRSLARYLFSCTTPGAVTTRGSLEGCPGAGVGACEKLANEKQRKRRKNTTVPEDRRI